MSYTRQALYPCNPGTERGRSTKLAAANVKGSDKIIYVNGRSVIVSPLSYLAFPDDLAYLTYLSSSSISRWVSSTACLWLGSNSDSLGRRRCGW
jgi:hypothetical protein